MPIVFACATSHAPGMTAWPEAAPNDQAEKILGSYRKLGEMLAASKPDTLVAITVEHWANFFLNHMPAFCIGRADHYEGPIEEWLRIPKARVPGDAKLSAELLRCLSRWRLRSDVFRRTALRPRDHAPVAFSQSQHGCSSSTRYHQYPDATHADPEAMLRLWAVSWKRARGIRKTRRRHCHRRPVPLARGGQTWKNQHSLRQEISQHLSLR